MCLLKNPGEQRRQERTKGQGSKGGKEKEEKKGNEEREIAGRKMKEQIGERMFPLYQWFQLLSKTDHNFPLRSMCYPRIIILISTLWLIFFIVSFCYS